MKRALRSLVYDIVRIDVADLQAAYLLQSAAWARVKSQFGWEAVAFRQTRYAHLQQDVLVLLQRVRGFGYLMYVPDGLLLHGAAAHYTAQAYQSARENAFDILFDIAHLIYRGYTKRVFCVRWDAPWCVKHEDAEAFFSSSFLEARQSWPWYQCPKGSVYGGAYVQPPATVVVDVTQTEAELLKAMKPKTRYNIRLAQKKGVSIAAGVSLDAFYDLYKITSKRNGIAIHSKEYYAAVLKALSEGDGCEVQLYGAYFENELIAAGMVSYYRGVAEGTEAREKEACYLYGATSNEHRNLMPMYLLQWHAMREAQKAACTHYDLFGIPLNEGAGSMQGLYRFKVGFGGCVQLRGGGFACVSAGKHAQLTYALFGLAERAYTRMLKLRAALRAKLS